jgi:hypothetical protein
MFITFENQYNYSIILGNQNNYSIILENENNYSIILALVCKTPEISSYVNRTTGGSQNNILRRPVEP